MRDETVPQSGDPTGEIKKSTAGELIRALQKFPADMPVTFCDDGRPVGFSAWANRGGRYVEFY
jgi:hypothetical protein